MNNHQLAMALSLAIWFALPNRAEAGLGGHARIEHAVGTQDGATALSRQQLQLEADSDDGRCEAKLALRLRRDAQLASRSHSEIDVRSAQLECRAGLWLWAVGRQSVVWGKADGFAILDAVHSFDLREFVLQDRESIRRPLTMLRVERRFGDEDFLQALIIPEVRYDRIPEGHARFSEPWGAWSALAEMVDIEGSEWWLRHPQWGAKWEHSGARLGWTLNALRRTSAQPVLEWDATAGLIATPHRQWAFGGSFDLQAGEAVVRGEWLHQPRTVLPVSATELRTASFHSTGWMLGVDQHWGNWLVGTQFFQQLHHGDTLPPVVGTKRDSVTLLATRSYWDDRLRLRGFLTQDLSQSGTWASVKMQWQWSPRLALTMQGDRFHGSSSSTFAQLERQSRINLSAQVDF